MDKRTRYSPEVRERSVRLMQEQAPAHGSQWAAIQSIAGNRVYGGDVAPLGPAGGA